MSERAERWATQLETCLRARGCTYDPRAENWRQWYLPTGEHLCNVPLGHEFVDYERCVLTALKCAAEGLVERADLRDRLIEAEATEHLDAVRRATGA